jgi:uncharacterized membrane protein
MKKESFTMEKSKLGLPVGLFGALIFAMAYFGGYMVLFLLVGYVLIREEDAWLRRTAVKAVLVSVAFSVINLLLGLVPDMIGIVDDLFNVFGSYFSIPFISNVLNLLGSIISFVKMLVFVALGVLCLSKKQVKIPVIDDFLEKNVG